jgi:hypothetical protein
MPRGGWAWRSEIQAPHHRTDRVLGAASIGEGLLAAYAVTGDARYRRAAVGAGDFLLGVAEPEDGGLRWPDWADPDGERSTTHFTRFDDGAAGISDYLWHLYRVTRERRFRAGALAGMRWLLARTDRTWRWTDDPDWRVAYHGVGMGAAGIVLVNLKACNREAARRAGAWLRRVRSAPGTWVEWPGSHSPVHVGLDSGAAGIGWVLGGRQGR